MNYVCFFHLEKKKLGALSPDELDALVGEHMAYDDELRASGHVVVVGGLQPARTAAASASSRPGI